MGLHGLILLHLRSLLRVAVLPNTHWSQMAPLRFGARWQILWVVSITKIGTVSTDINHVLISGGSSVLNYWGTLANIAGKLSITSIGTVELNLNHVLISGDTVVPNYWGTLANIAVVNHEYRYCRAQCKSRFNFRWHHGSKLLGHPCKYSG